MSEKYGYTSVVCNLLHYDLYRLLRQYDRPARNDEGPPTPAVHTVNQALQISESSGFTFDTIIIEKSYHKTDDDQALVTFTFRIEGTHATNPNQFGFLDFAVVVDIPRTNQPSNERFATLEAMDETDWESETFPTYVNAILKVLQSVVAISFPKDKTQKISWFDIGLFLCQPKAPGALYLNPLAAQATHFVVDERTYHGYRYEVEELDQEFRQSLSNVCLSLSDEGVHKRFERHRTTADDIQVDDDALNSAVKRLNGVVDIIVTTDSYSGRQSLNPPRRNKRGGQIAFLLTSDTDILTLSFIHARMVTLLIRRDAPHQCWRRVSLVHRPAGYTSSHPLATTHDRDWLMSVVLKWPADSEEMVDCILDALNQAVSEQIPAPC